MNEKAIHKLEFDKIREILSDKATSQLAKEMCRKLTPLVSLFELERAQSETEEAFRYLVHKGNPSFFGLTDIRASVNRCGLDAAISMGELLEIARVLRLIDSLKLYGNRDPNQTGSYEILDPMFAGLMPFPRLEQEISACILSEDEMSDDASPRLHAIRREIHLTESRIQNELQRMIRSESVRSLLQDPIVTLRKGRYCLPVKSEQKSSVAGMVHDQSSSGSTLFIEPMAVVEMNNAIAELHLQEADEILRILKEFSQKIHAGSEEILSSFHLLVSLDFIFAKGQLTRMWDAVRPSFNEEGIIDLKKARHPLLDPKKVVPIDVRLGETYTSLVITGPNTGGKTVTLKTLGLLQLMGLSGLHIPASEHPRLTLLSEIYADIGDEQSIEQSLSTFSSHMVNIVDILQKADAASLVLFDELGAGTDPTEGAALAQAILEHLRSKAILTAATTHYSELKIYALSTDGVENASCEFNVDTLMPTYRLLIGIPGKSNAFAISRKLGLSDEIIHDASLLLESNDVKFEDMISDLETKRVQIEHEKREIDALRREISVLEADARDKKTKLTKQQEQILEKARREAKEILKSAKAEADHALSRINKLIQEGGHADIRALETERARLREEVGRFEEKEESFDPDLEKGSVRPEELTLGTLVRVHGFEQPLSVVSLPDPKGSLQVQAGIMRLSVRVSDIWKIVSDKELLQPKGKTRRKEGAAPVSRSRHVSHEIDLRGLLTDDGISALDKYLDDAYLSSLTTVRIIHGKGTGAMRDAVHAFLKRNPHVQSYRLGVLGEGDTGVTVATLRSKNT